MRNAGLEETQGYGFFSSHVVNSHCFFSIILNYQFSSALCLTHSLRPHGLQHASPPCPSPTPGVYSNSVHWVGDAIQPSHPLLSSSPPAFSLSQHQGLFQWVGSSHQVATSIGVSASASVLPVNIQDWFPLEWTGWIFLQSKRLKSLLQHHTVQKHQFFSAQLSLQSNSHIHTWPLAKP